MKAPVWLNSCYIIQVCWNWSIVCACYMLLLYGNLIKCTKIVPENQFLGWCYSEIHVICTCSEAFFNVKGISTYTCSFRICAIVMCFLVGLHCMRNQGILMVYVSDINPCFKFQKVGLRPCCFNSHQYQ